MSCESCPLPGSCKTDYTIRPFGRMGVSVYDLFNKGYNFQSQFSTRKIAKNGVGIESGVLSSCGGGGVDGYIKSDYSFPQFDVEGRVETTGELSGGVRYKHDRQNTAALAGAITGPKYRHPSKASSVLTVESANNTYAAALRVFLDNTNKKHNTPVPELGASVKVLDTGAIVGINAKAESAKAFEVNVGGEFTHGIATASVHTTGKLDGVTTSVIVKATPDIDVGASVEIAPKNTRVVSAAVEYRMDRDTTAKIKADSTGSVSTFLEHRLFNPLLRFGISSTVDLHAKKLAANQLGIGMSFGDYTA